LFEATLDLSVDERASFLADQCGDDHALRGEIDRLLGHDQAAGASFLGKPIDPLPTPRNDSTWNVSQRMEDALISNRQLPRTIGHYEVVRLIGTGGMGAVYEARQVNPSRMVALKVVRPDFVARGTIARFLREAHILGQLQHPGIAQIYEAGMAPVAEGPDSPCRPYFAMELVHGMALHEHAKQIHLGIREMRTHSTPCGRFKGIRRSFERCRFLLMGRFLHRLRKMRWCASGIQRPEPRLQP